MTRQSLQTQVRSATPVWSRTWLGLVAVALLAIAACGGTTTSPVPTVGGGGATTAPTASGSGGAACIDAETAAIIQSLTAADADVEAIITQQGDELVAGLQSFTPPPDAATWRDDLVAAIEEGDADAVRSQIQMIGTEVTLEFC